MGGGDTGFGKDVYLGGADIGVVDHGVWTDGECPADLASFGAKGLSKFLFKNRDGGSAGSRRSYFGASTADACFDAFHRWKWTCFCRSCFPVLFHNDCMWSD